MCLSEKVEQDIAVPALACEPALLEKLQAEVPSTSGGAVPDVAPAAAKLKTNIMASQIAPRAVAGSRNPTVPTPEDRDKFEPMLRAKEAMERRKDVKCLSFTFIVWTVYSVVSMMRGTETPAGAAWKVVTFLAASYAADVVTGCLHIYLDHRRCDLGDPLDMAAYSFRYDHHAHPLNFLKDSALFPAGASDICMSATAPLSLALHAYTYYRHGCLPLSLPADSPEQLRTLFAMIVLLFGSLCQTTHALAHEGKIGRNKTFPNTVSLLQRLHLILPPKTHGQHHWEDHDKNFCIFNGWANPMFNRLSLVIFWLMRQAPGHFDARAVPGPDSWAANQKRARGEKVD